MVETITAEKSLLKEGFDVMVYCSEDSIMAKRLEEIGCCTVIPLASLIGSGIDIFKSMAFTNYY